MAVLVSWAGFVAFFLIMQCSLCVQELAVVVARGRDNSVLCYPVVETIHKYVFFATFYYPYHGSIT